MNDKGGHPVIAPDDEEDTLEPSEQDVATVVENSKMARQREEMPSLGMVFEPGARVGRYRLLAPIASGGMAQVWAARPEGAGFARTVALKLIRHEYASDEEYARMFIDEATVAAAIQHPNVCETYELGRAEGVLFMALEWVAGDSLAGVLHRGAGMEPVSYHLGARIVADACAGLHAAHEATDIDGNLLNVVHRDVSPPNILIGLHGQVKVSDFGIAKARYQLHSRTRTGEIKGKLSYLAPEQIGSKAVDRRVDIFALGCVLYVATLGLRPFGSGPRAMGKILTGNFRRPNSLVENYPPELQAVIERCLQRSPADRYATADEMRLDLERWLLSSGATVGAQDIATLLQSCISPEKRRVIDMLLRNQDALADTMVNKLMRDEQTQTPTATSSVSFGPAESDARAPAPVSGSKISGRPAVRFSPFNTPVPSVDDTELQRISDTERMAAASRDTPEAATGATSAPDLTAQGDVQPELRGAASAPTRPGKFRRSPAYRWLGLGLLIALGLALAAGWATCHQAPENSVGHHESAR